MPLEANTAGSPEDWLRYAKSDLRGAEIDYYDDFLYSNRCFRCQQAVEKAIKGVLIKNGINFPKTHDIKFLLYQF